MSSRLMVSLTTIVVWTGETTGAPSTSFVPKKTPSSYGSKRFMLVPEETGFSQTQPIGQPSGGHQERMRSHAGIELRARMAPRRKSR